MELQMKLSCYTVNRERWEEEMGRISGSDFELMVPYSHGGEQEVS